MKNRINFATYSQDFYTGAQCRIYFGSIFVDDIATIQYTASHNKIPLYGYADHQFRSVAKGQFLVRGSFTIAFKETGYLYQIMKLYREDKTKGYRQKTDSKDTFLNLISKGSTIEDAMDALITDKNPQDFEDAAEVMEDAIWGKEGTPSDFSRRIPRSDELDYFKYTTKDKTSTDIDVEGFDMLLTFGDFRGSDSPEHTIISINDVHITGESLVVTPAAEPIGMTYEFFARGINEKVSSAWPIGEQEIVKQANEEGKDDLDKLKTDIAEAKEAIKDVSDQNKDNDTLPQPAQTTQQYTITGTQPFTINNEIKPIYNIKESVIKNIEPSKQLKIIYNQPIIEFPPLPEKYIILIDKIVKGDKTTILNKAKLTAKKEGVNLNGGPDKGTLSGKGLEGVYYTSGDKLRIIIIDKPFFITDSFIKNKINMVFK